MLDNRTIVNFNYHDDLKKKHQYDNTGIWERERERELPEKMFALNTRYNSFLYQYCLVCSVSL